MYRLNIRGSLFTSLFLLLCFIAVQIPPAEAARKVSPCKILRKNICVSKKAIPKRMREVVPENLNFITPLVKSIITSGDFSEFPDNDEGKTGISVPAGIKTTTVCRITANGKFECTVLSAFNECPSSMIFFDEASKSSYECDLDCASRNPSGKPDSQGNCDCDVLYNTCEARG